MKNKNLLFSALVLFTLLAWVILYYLALYYIPADYRQGLIQRVFYFHLATAFTSFVAFIVSFYYAVKYLFKRDLKDDALAFTFILTGWLFTTGVLITGPLWAKTQWGAYWDWSDQRLISFFVMWMLYSAYLILRISIAELHTRARLSSVLSILAFFMLPLVYFSIRIWTTPSHPPPLVGGNEADGLKDVRMHYLVWYAFFCFMLLFHLLSKIVKRQIDISTRLQSKGI